MNEFDERQAALNERRSELNRQLDRADFDWREGIKQAGIQVATNLDEKYNQEAVRNRERYQSLLIEPDTRLAEIKSDLLKQGLTEEQANAHASRHLAEETASARKKVFDDIIATSFTQLGVALAQGEKFERAALVIAIDAASAWLEAMIPVWVAGAFGTTVAELGIFGLLAAGAAVSAV